MAARIVYAQVAATALVAVAFALQGMNAALGALSGGLMIALGTALSAARTFNAPLGAGAALMRLLVGVVLKWFVVLCGMYLALVHWALPPLPVLVGLGAALTMNLVGLRFKE